MSENKRGNRKKIVALKASQEERGTIEKRQYTSNRLHKNVAEPRNREKRREGVGRLKPEVDKNSYYRRKFQGRRAKTHGQKKVTGRPKQGLTQGRREGQFIALRINQETWVGSIEQEELSA